MSHEQDIFLAKRAQHLLEDEVLTQAFADVRAAIIEKWEGSPIRDSEGQHELKLMLRLLTEVRGNLELAVTNGKLAAADLRTRNQPLTPAEWRAANPR